MSLSTFLIQFKVFSLQGVLLKQGSMRVKRKHSESEAKNGIETHLKKTVPQAHRIVIVSCKNETKELQDADIVTLAKMLRDKKAKAIVIPEQKERGGWFSRNKNAVQIEQQ